jgi:2-C-methyl-D-erythritol 4-phosphate cytidylyltransferase/2-C-methyl-D-erythritol 2,4-cyclodiphosphate synthase
MLGCTVTDAIYGYASWHDIGHFPPSDPHWKALPADIFTRLRRCSRNGLINHMDCIDLRIPKDPAPLLAMRMRMAQIMGIDADRVSVKATTSNALVLQGADGPVMAGHALIKGAAG